MCSQEVLGVPRLAIGLSLPNRGILFGAITVEEMLAMSEFADASEAFDSVWVGDSLFAKPRVEAVATLCAIASRTRRVKLGTACLASFPLREPRLFACQWASLDVLSGGRSLLCVCMGASGGSGMGEARREVEIMAFDPRERVGRFEEGIEVVRKLWEGDDVDHHGPFYSFEGASLRPKPVQKPCPIWIANNPPPEKPDLEARAYRRVARLADGWMTDGGPTPAEFGRRWEIVRRFLLEEGKSPEAFYASYHMMINIDDDPERGWREGVEFLTRYYGPMDEAFLRVWLAAGPPREVARRIQEYIDHGCSLPILRFAAWSGMAQLRRGLDEVLPLLRPDPTGGRRRLP
jgi:alkanesulfonate monooxygenase SsuD/methylene tetrahydromethanopterin reductase-like flavin-dependent oxidoreductase (luciferase family)